MLRALSKTSFLFLAAGIFAALIGGCSKSHFEERVEGLWERVNVADIHATQGELWELQNNHLNIYHFNKANPENKWLVQQGKYLIIRRGTKVFLKLANLSYSTYNTSWEIFRLNKTELVISIEVPGGIFYKEFIKNSGN